MATTISTGATVTTPLTADRQVVTTTVQESKVRGPRVRLFVTGFIMLLFGGFALIPVCLLAAHPLMIVACAWLAFSGMIGILGACISSSKSSTSIKYDASTRTQSVVTVPPIFPRFYVGLMIVAFLLSVASAAVGIWLLTMYAQPFWLIVQATVLVSLGVFYCLVLMLTICCISPMARNRTQLSEQVHVVAGPSSPPPVMAPQSAHGAYAPNNQLPYAAGAAAGPSGNLYPYIDEPIKEGPPSYQEATRGEPRTDYNPYPTKQPTAPPDF